MKKLQVTGDRHLLQLGAKAQVETLEVDIANFTARFESGIQPLRDEVAALRRRFPSIPPAPVQTPANATPKAGRPMSQSAKPRRKLSRKHKAALQAGREKYARQMRREKKAKGKR